MEIEKALQAYLLNASEGASVAKSTPSSITELKAKRASSVLSREAETATAVPTRRHATDTSRVPLQGAQLAPACRMPPMIYGRAMPIVVDGTRVVRYYTDDSIIAF
jgi:hypothetical protein